jgi:ComF family protein
MLKLLDKSIAYSADILNILFPPKCLKCETFIHSADTGLCHKCWANINFITDPKCYICSHPFEYSSSPYELCLKCVNHKPLYDKVYTVFKYDEHSKDLMHKFKYNDRTYMAKYFAKWILRTIPAADLAEVDIIATAPMHKMRLLRRMYNQAALIAGRIARTSDKEFIPDLLLKVRHTPSQAGLTRNQRVANLRGSIELNKKYHGALKGKTILLIDDVLTTGSTINVCTKQLLISKPKSVMIATVART